MCCFIVVSNAMPTSVCIVEVLSSNVYAKLTNGRMLLYLLKQNKVN